MKIQKINNSPSFQTIQLSTKEGRTVAGIIRSYRKQANPALREQLIDIYAPHIEREANAQEGILKQDYIHDMYLCLFENLETVNTKFHPASNLTNALNETPRENSLPSIVHKTLEEVTDTELAKLSESENEFIHKLNIGEYMLDSKEIIRRADITPREQYILLAKLDGKKDKEIGNALNLTTDRVRQIAAKSCRKLYFDKKFNERVYTEGFSTLAHIYPNEPKRF